MLKTKHIIETHDTIRLRSASDGKSLITKESGKKLDDLINEFIFGKNLVDIKYWGNYPASALILYTEDEK